MRLTYVNFVVLPCGCKRHPRAKPYEHKHGDRIYRISTRREIYVEQLA